MLVLLGALLTLVASSGAVPCPDYCEVVSSVFQPKVSVNFNDAQLVCDCYKADLANLEQVTRMHNHSYQSCSWGWVKEQKMVMLRNEVDDKCGNSSTGVLHKTPCVHIEAQSAVCFKRNVVKGVFQVFAENNKTEGSRVCGTFNATWATWDQLDTANSSGYATCSAGLVANMTQYKFMDISGLNCTNGTSTNETDSKAIAFFCFRAALFPVKDTNHFFTSVNRTGFVSEFGSRRQKVFRTAWYQDGIIQQSANGTMEEVPCVNYPHVNGSVFCYKANLADAVCVDNTSKKIAMGCILASIFAVLLIAAICMRGNQFICCLDKPHLVSVGNSTEVRRVAPQEPTWNTTGIYTAVKDVVNPAYSSSLNIIPEPRLPAIRPEMLNYRSHLSFVIPRPDLPATLHGQSRVYDNLGYDASEDQ